MTAQGPRDRWLHALPVPSRGRYSLLVVDAIAGGLTRLGLSLSPLGATRPVANDCRGTEWVDASLLELALERTIELSGDESLGLRVGEALPFTALDALGLLPGVSPHLLGVLETLVELQRSVCDTSRLTLVEGERLVGIRITPSEPQSPSQQFLAECFGAVLARVVRSLSGRDASSSRWTFAHEVANEAPHRRTFPGAVEFGARHVALYLPRDVAERPNVLFNPPLAEDLRACVARLLPATATRPPPLSRRIREHLEHLPPTERPTARSVARRLGISERTLSERLAREGTTLAEMVATHRAGVALDALQDPLRSIKDAAFTLGFSDPSAFHRAFKRWTGITPQQARRLT